MKATDYMRIREYLSAFEADGEVVTAFGGARLVKYPDGELELQGGSKGDRVAAYEWMSLVWHEAVVREVVSY